MSALTSIIPIFIPHIGCPHDCVFCDQKRIAGTVNAPTPDMVRDEVVHALSRGHKEPPQVAFYGGSFTAIPEAEQQAYLDSVQEFIKDGRISGIRVSTRPDFINDRIVSRLLGCGVNMVELGIQSFDDAVLNASGRGHSREDGIVAAECLKRNGMPFILQLMAGLPKDSRQTAVLSAETAAQLKPNGIRIYPVAVIEKTALADMYQSGKYTPLSIESAVEWSADMLEVFIKADIPVIRIGLNPSESLEPAVVAGAYHPALGELVRSRVYLRRARQALAGLGLPEGAKAVIIAGKKYISAVCGQRARNRIILKDEFKLSQLRVREGDVPEWHVMIEEMTEEV